MQFICRKCYKLVVSTDSSENDHSSVDLVS